MYAFVGGGCYFGFLLAAVSECGTVVGICLSVCLFIINTQDEMWKGEFREEGDAPRFL